MKEAKYRVEDAVSATRAALEEGIVPGGGVALLEAATRLREDAVYKKAVGDEARGMDIVIRALERPLRAIAENAGKTGNDVLEEVRKKGKGTGYDAEKGQFVKMVDAGIIDPLKVVKAELTSAASVVGLILTTEAAIADAPEKKEQGRGGSMGGGMEDYE
jgi:chaperonin GroEL